MRRYTKLFHVRAFDSLNPLPSNCKGAMEDHGNVVDDQVLTVKDAISTIKLGSDCRVQNDDQGATKINITLRADGLNEVPARNASIRTGVLENLTRWAEKSRVKGLRGWRVNAVREPKFKKVNGEIHVVTTIIVGNNVRYDDTASAVYDLDQHLAEDVDNLARRFKKKRGWSVDSYHGTAV